MAAPMTVEATTPARAVRSSGHDQARVSASVTMTVSAARTVVTPSLPVSRNRPRQPGIGLPTGANVAGVARMATGKLETVFSGEVIPTSTGSLTCGSGPSRTLEMAVKPPQAQACASSCADGDGAPGCLLTRDLGPGTGGDQDPDGAGRSAVVGGS
jgi:hypothetical protein